MKLSAHQAAGVPAPAHRMVAEMLMRSGKEPVRLNRNGGLKKPMGLYFSAKSGRHLPWESRNELHAFWWAEVRSDVVESWAQPHTLKMTIGGQVCRYTPDREDALAGGSTEIVEVKNDLDALKDPFYAAKLEQARLIYEGLGFGFRITTKSELERQPAFSAVETIQRNRGVYVSQFDLEEVQSALDAGPMPLGSLTDRLGGRVRGLPTVAALVVRRVVTLDLLDGLAGDTAISLVSSTVPHHGSVGGSF